MVLLALARLAAASPKLALPQENPTWAWGGRLFSGCSPHVLPTGYQSECSGLFEGLEL